LDNNGDGKEDITFQFQFKNELANSGAGITLPVGGKNVSIPLRQAGAVTNAPGAPLSYTESFTLNVVRGDRRQGTRAAVTTAGGGTTFGKPIDYIGTKTFPGNSYEGYANSYIQAINIPGCATPGKVFVGQRKEAFSVNLGAIFDLVNAPAAFITNEANAAAAGKFGELENKNVTSLALEVPASCLTQGTTEKVIGAWTTASLRQGRLLNGATPSGLQASEKSGGAWTQVSRLGMPLVNEVVIGLKDKDKFNGSKPLNDAANFADYVTNPTLPALIETLFGAKAPTNFPRTDLMSAFLTGLPTVNRPANVTALGVGGPLTEMLRLNTSIAATPAATQKSLGVAAGDNAGFPNGRRLGDDVVDVSLRVAMGALCVLTGDTDALKVGCKPADAPAGGVAFVDGVRASATDFQQVFPYLNTPLPGAK
ncbi:MAG: hypothetical protein JWP96_515, partial [Polaromonas sp.]|nr:hypothetical protein [Polaromonas sp.]